ncbi:MAG TPA: BadF/BadG/BcrA/BcrD ATPase family protein [Candidatus Acidoferrum sp.]|nr:BadF/BadG/BcrA/BcrD ATPase family protein [Candidatus Acidoferrum sp.]
MRSLGDGLPGEVTGFPPFAQHLTKFEAPNRLCIDHSGPPQNRRVLHYAFLMPYVLGFDGGGTKTECVLMDETGAILARSRSGPSNAVNVGAKASAAALADAGLEALRSSGKPPSDVVYILAGISGAGEPTVQAEIKAVLQPSFASASIMIISDLPLTLAATNEIPSVVVIAGTGSAVLGWTSPHHVFRAGGFGPIIGDAGSANDIGRKTVALCFQKILNKEKFLLTDEILRAFHCTWLQFVDLAREQPTVIFPKIFPIVAKAAQSGDQAAQAILSMAAVSLLDQVREVANQLQLRNTSFFLAKTGGVFDGSSFLNGEFDGLVAGFYPKARIGPLPRPVAESAAQLARDALTSPLQIPES